MMLVKGVDRSRKNEVDGEVSMKEGRPSRCLQRDQTFVRRPTEWQQKVLVWHGTNVHSKDNKTLLGVPSIFSMMIGFVCKDDSA